MQRDFGTFDLCDLEILVRHTGPPEVRANVSREEHLVKAVCDVIATVLQALRLAIGEARGVYINADRSSTHGGGANQTLALRQSAMSRRLSPLFLTKKTPSTQVGRRVGAVRPIFIV